MQVENPATTVRIVAGRIIGGFADANNLRVSLT
jgi:hypothetical protein